MADVQLTAAAARPDEDVSLIGRSAAGDREAFEAVIGGGPGSFIGAMHRTAARLDGRYELVASTDA